MRSANPAIEVLDVLDVLLDRGERVSPLDEVHRHRFEDLQPKETTLESQLDAGDRNTLSIMVALLHARRRA